MLQSIRDKSKGWLAYIIVGFISIPFLFWGIQQYLGVGGELVAAKVNDTEISLRDFQRSLQQQQQQMRSMLGGKVPAEMLQGSAIQQSVVSNMIREELLRQYSAGKGLRISDNQLLSEIKGQESFQEEGVFNKQKYERLLEQQRLTKSGFEYQVRTSMQLNQFQDALVSSVFIPSSSQKDFLGLKGQKRKIDYVIFDKEQFRSSASPGAEEIEKYYQENQQNYVTKEQVKISYIVLDEAELASQVSVDDNALQTFYEQEKDLYRVPEARKVSHILIKASQEDGADELAVAESRAKEIHTKIMAGADFFETAKETSEDKLSAEQGGDLGFISPGDMDPAFEKALFSLSVDSISEPVKTPQGYHILKLIEVRPAKVKSFDEAKPEVEQEFRQREAEQVLIEKSELLVTLSYENSDSLAPVSDALGIEVKTSGWISRDQGEGIAADQRVRQAAFLPEVLQQKRNSDVIETDDGKQIVLRLAEHQPSKPKPLAEVKDLIVQQLVDNFMRDKVKALGEAKLELLRQGTDLKSIAAQIGADLKSPGFVAREDERVPAEIRDRIFTLSGLKKGESVPAGVVMSDGNYALVSLTEVKIPEINLDDKNSQNLVNSIKGSYQQREFEAVYQALESRSDIKIYNENLQQ
ncbi:MAG: peptidylprolyl isomerase [Thiothrix sp.]|nr:MAG: peptidylprolyl isomerase [Thiothrix sp.]